jgi:hypothetical protein
MPKNNTMILAVIALIVAVVAILLATDIISLPWAWGR